jgi:hypothetical protein
VGGIGWQNGLPFQIGGGESDTETVYRALRQSVGGREGGGAGPEGGIEDAWRMAKAEAIAAAGAVEERAALQAFPQHATDFLDVWESTLGVPPAGSTADRQAACAAALTAQVSAIVPHLRTEIQRVAPNADVDALPDADAVASWFGKVLGARTGAPPVGYGQTAGVTAATWANFSDHFVLRVRFVLPAGVVAPPTEELAQLAALLNATLPAWVDWSVYTSVGFFFDGGEDGSSLFDVTTFGE